MNLHNAINQIEQIDPEIYERLDNRRSAVKQFASFSGKLALAAVPIAFGSMFKKAYGQSASKMIADVLNFALTLEYLEAGFYKKGLASSGLIPAGDDWKAMETISMHETAHVAFLKSALTSLGAKPVSEPTFDYTAKGTFGNVFSNYGTFLAVSQTFEDTGVRAYKGQAANLMSSNEVLGAALQIHSVEARHASHVREMRNRNGFNANVKPWISFSHSGIGLDVVKPSYMGEGNTIQAGIEITNINGLPVDNRAASEAFDEPLSKDEILKIVTPFFA